MILRTLAITLISLPFLASSLATLETRPIEKRDGAIPFRPLNFKIDFNGSATYDYNHPVLDRTGDLMDQFIEHQDCIVGELKKIGHERFDKASVAFKSKDSRKDNDGHYVIFEMEIVRWNQGIFDHEIARHFADLIYFLADVETSDQVDDFLRRHDTAGGSLTVTSDVIFSIKLEKGSYNEVCTGSSIERRGNNPPCRELNFKHDFSTFERAIKSQAMETPQLVLDQLVQKQDCIVQKLRTIGQAKGSKMSVKIKSYDRPGQYVDLKMEILRYNPGIVDHEIVRHMADLIYLLAFVRTSDSAEMQRIKLMWDTSGGDLTVTDDIKFTVDPQSGKFDEDCAS